MPPGKRYKRKPSYRIVARSKKNILVQKTTYPRRGKPRKTLRRL